MSLLPASEIDAIRATLAGTTNARLKAITTPGRPDRNGDPTDGTDLWTGDAPCWLERRRHDAVSGGQQVPVRQDSLTVLDAEVPVVEVAGPDWQATVVTVEDRRTGTPVTVRFEVRAMEHVAYNLIDSTRLELDEITA